MSAFVDSETFQDLIRKWPNAVLQYLRKRYYRRLVYISAQTTRNREASEEIVHDALIEIWKRSEWLAKQDGLLIGPYLLRIVKNKSITFYHQSVSRKEDNQPADLLDELISSMPSIESGLIKADKYNKLRDIVSTLPDGEKSVIELKYFHGLSNDAVGREMGISKRTVEKYHTRAIEHLRAQKAFIG